MHEEDLQALGVVGGRSLTEYVKAAYLSGRKMDYEIAQHYGNPVSKNSSKLEGYERRGTL